MSFYKITGLFSSKMPRPSHSSRLKGPKETGQVNAVTDPGLDPDNFTFTFHFHALEKEMSTHSSILAWEIPQRSLQGYSPWGFKRVGHN